MVIERCTCEIPDKVLYDPYSDQWVCEVCAGIIEEEQAEQVMDIAYGHEQVRRWEAENERQAKRRS